MPPSRVPHSTRAQRRGTPPHAPRVVGGLLQPGEASPSREALTLSEIRQRAIRFAREWQGASRERSEAQTFWNEFFAVFGVNRRRFATFEHPAMRADGVPGWADLLWPGVVLIEHKSLGVSLDTAYTEASGYLARMPPDQIPRFIVVSDFARFRVYDRDTPGADPATFTLENLPRNLHRFSFLTEWDNPRPAEAEEDPVNRRAAELMGRLHDTLAEEARYTGHPLEVLLVRLLFCMFADYTDLFEPRGWFRRFIDRETQQNPASMGPTLTRLFQVLNTDQANRPPNLQGEISGCPYVDGLLFEEQLPVPEFTASMRELLLECCGYNWRAVSPAVFGSMFQAVMDSTQRREMGAHYTSEANILKLIGPLFLDDLKADLERCGNRARLLEDFQARLGSLRFLDPACGCGNFLAIAYREIRRLETEAIVRMRRAKGEASQMVLGSLSVVNVAAFYGIEVMEFPARIAEVSLWLTDHLMNLELLDRTGFDRPSLPLRMAPHIKRGNALDLDWGELLPPSQASFVLGNPPYGGKQGRTDSQKADVDRVMGGRIHRHRTLDYVSCWFVKASEYVRGTQARVAFVSTNAITHGEQVGPLWSYLLRQGVQIHFAHRPFHWRNEARGRAGVTVVIIGFGPQDIQPRRLFDYLPDSDSFVESQVQNINPYLVDGPTVLLPSRREPIQTDTPRILFGSMPNDGGHLLLSNGERAELLSRDPAAEPMLRRFVGAREFLHNEPRLCLWLKGIAPEEISGHREIHHRLALVKQHRETSDREETQRLAATPSLFGEDRQPSTEYVLVPGVASEGRHFIPMGFVGPETVASNACLTVPGASRYHFGILQSEMHMAWVRQICGRLRKDYRYSNEIVYNNFPWPINPTAQQRAAIEEAATGVLEARARIGGSLAAMYDPLLMPRELAEAHKALDRAVDKCYRRAAFRTDLGRLKHLFQLYIEIVQQTETLDSFTLNTDGDNESGGQEFPR